MTRIKRFSCRLPNIIKNELGEEVYNTMARVIEESPEKGEYVIYTSPQMIDAINKAIDEELKTKYNIL